MSKTTTSANYQVLARKYRPMSFEDMIGQAPLVKTLTNAFATGRIAHAFMLTGVRGIGKTTTARLLARALNYESDDHDGPSVNLTPPGKHCDAINRSAHMDVMEMDAASRTGVGDIREILDSVRYGPIEARYKVYIIDEVHMLSTQAFNALLKTLEEPPEHAKFIFATTEIRKIPITVLSRCQRFDLKRVEADELTAHLKNICTQEKANIEADGLKLIARAAEGSVRDGLSLLDQAIVQADTGRQVSAEDIRAMLGLADRTRVLDLFGFATSNKAKEALQAASTQYKEGADPTVIIRDLMDVCHDVSRAKVMGEACEFDLAPDQISRLHDLAGRLSMGQITRVWKMLLGAYSDVRIAPDPLAALEMALLRLCTAAELPPPEKAAPLLAALAHVKDKPTAKHSASTKSASSAPVDRVMAGAQVGAQAQPAPEARTNAAPTPKLETSPKTTPKTLPKTLPEISSLPELVAALPKNMRGFAFDVEKYIRPIKMEAGSLVFSLAPGAPKELEYKLRAWLTEATARPWHVELSKTEQGAPSIREAQKQAEKQRDEREANHPIAKLARELFGNIDIEFRDRAPMSNVLEGRFDKERDET